MLRIALTLLCLGTSASAVAQNEWQGIPTVEVRLSNFDYAPETIHLRAGQPVVLHLVNVAGGGHNFSAPQFFAAANVRAQDRAAIHGGAVEVASHASLDVALVPAAGRYKLKCTHTFHKMFGMSGDIVVD